MNQDEKPPKPIYVYTLSDPRTGAVRYVGVTDNPHRRLKDHMSHAKCKDVSHRARWINLLLSEGLKPIMDIIDETNNEEWKQCEIEWIAHYRAIGCNLVNTTNGGDGARGYVHTTESLKKISEGNKGKKVSEETRRKVGDANRGKIRTEQHRYNMSEAQKRRLPISEETRRKKIESNPNKRAVLQYDSFGHFIRQWDSARQAGRELGIDNSRISKCCKEGGMAGGCIWRFTDDPILGIPPMQLKIDFE